MLPLPTISAIIITKNEAENIEACLESVSWTDEIIVVDSGSTDGTTDICRRFTSKVFDMSWPGFGPQKNRALDKAGSEWVLSIDADERVTDELKQEILDVIASGTADAYLIPRTSSYCGKFIRHSGWSPDFVLRLFRKKSGRFSEDIIHEKVVSTGKISKLNHPIIHYTFRDLEKLLDTINRYSTAGAEMRFSKGQRATLAGAITRGVWTFFRTYILKLGFLDGAEGFMLAVSNAEGTYYKYLKLRLLSLRQKQQI